MNDPLTPPSLQHQEEFRAPESQNLSEFPPARTLLERIFQGANTMRARHLALYLAAGAATFYLALLFGTLLFPDVTHGATVLWQEMYQEFALFLGALLPAFLMARLEERPVDDYGLPLRQAFGKMFWLGTVWGLAAITVLLIVMRGLHVLYFGHFTLHGARILKFAAFWGIYFLIVGLFEEFLLRGYVLFTLTQSTGFWPAAVLLSCAFGAIHLRNPGEGWVGALGAAAIGFFFCLTLRRTGSLWFAVGFHAAWDWGETYFYAVPNSGTYEPGHLLSPSFHGPAWLTGGTVGPEGSVLCFALIVMLWALFLRVYPVAKYNP
jgi:uncharacterized protein